MIWSGAIPPLRRERHFGDRVVHCFATRACSINDVLAAAHTRNPRGDALVCGATRLTYDALAGEVAGAAGMLAGLGIGAGDRVALLMANSADFVVAFLGIVRLGAIAVPLNIREGPRELAFVLGDCGAKAVIHDRALGNSLPATTELPELRHRLAVDDGLVGAWARTRGDPGAPQAATVVAAEAAPVAEEDVAAILYTSGTTGQPKGAMLTHLGLVHSGMIYEACMGLGGGDRSIATVPLSHVTGLTAGIMAMLCAAGTLIVCPTFKADAFIALAVAEGMTHTVMVPAMYNLCLLSPAFASADLSAWRIGGFGGAPMPPATIARLGERLPHLQLFNAYGSTETTGPVVLMPPGETAHRANAVGRAVPAAEVVIMDASGREVASGASGEIWLRAANCAVGYWGNARATAESFVAGYWRSGDIGRIDGCGFLTLLDRAKDLVNRGGYKVYSVEVENVLASHAQVIEAAVIARPCPVLGERVHALVVAGPDFRDDVALVAHCAANLADYKVPESVTFLDAPLPRNANGKVLKRQLRDRWA